MNSREGAVLVLLELGCEQHLFWERRGGFMLEIEKARDAAHGSARDDPTRIERLERSEQGSQRVLFGRDALQVGDQLF
jgi:hypothetical protein